MLQAGLVLEETHCAIAAGCNFGVVQGCERIDDCVMAVCDPQDARREVVLPSHHCRFAHALNVHAAPCAKVPKPEVDGARHAVTFPAVCMQLCCLRCRPDIAHLAQCQLELDPLFCPLWVGC